MENFRKIRRPRPSLRRAWDHRRCGTWLFRRMALKRAVYFLSPQNLPKPPKTTQNPPKPSKGFFGTRRPTHQGHIKHFFLGLQGAINIFLLRSSLPFARLQTLQYPPKPPKTPKNSPKPSKGFFSTPDPAGQRTKATSTAFSWPSRRNQ